MSCNQRGQNASQPNLAGTGLGSFNDRFRDALVGGSPFGPPRYQGFSTGLATQPSSYMEVSLLREVFMGCSGEEKRRKGPVSLDVSTPFIPL